MGLTPDRKNFMKNREIQGTFWGRQRDRARVCSLCEVISHAETLKGHLDFFIRAFKRGHTKPLTERISLALQQSFDVLVCRRLVPRNNPQ